MMLQIIFYIVLLATFILQYINPKRSILFLRRWQFKEEPEVSEASIFIVKLVSLMSSIIITLALIIEIVRLF